MNPAHSCRSPKRLPNDENIFAFLHDPGYAHTRSDPPSPPSTSSALSMEQHPVRRRSILYLRIRTASYHNPQRAPPHDRTRPLPVAIGIVRITSAFLLGQEPWPTQQPSKINVEAPHIFVPSLGKTLLISKLDGTLRQPGLALFRSETDCSGTPHLDENNGRTYLDPILGCWEEDHHLVAQRPPVFITANSVGLCQPSRTHPSFAGSHLPLTWIPTDTIPLTLPATVPFSMSTSNTDGMESSLHRFEH